MQAQLPRPCPFRSLSHRSAGDFSRAIGSDYDVARRIVPDASDRAARAGHAPARAFLCKWAKTAGVIYEKVRLDKRSASDAALRADLVRLIIRIQISFGYIESAIDKNQNKGDLHQKGE